MSGLAVILTDAQLDSLAERVARRISPIGAHEPSEAERGLLTVNDVCDRLHVCRTTVYQMRRRGDLEAINIGSAIRFKSEDIEALRQSGAGR